MPKRSPFADAARAIGDAAARWRDADFPPRVRAQARIVERTHYSLPVVEYALDALFGSITADAILETIAAEIGDRDVQPVGRVAIVSSRTTIGVAIVPAIFAICAGCDVTVKDREDALVGAFFQTLGGHSFRAEAWRGGEHDLTQYDVVVAFGGDEALRAIREQMREDALFIPYGPKASIGYVGREALGDEAAARRIAEAAARDFLLYDGEGCLSLHALFVQRGGAISPQEFARTLASAARGAAVEFPLGARSPAQAARVAALRDAALFRDGPVHSDDEATFVIEMGEPARAPAFAPRVLAVHEVDSSDEMRAYVARHGIDVESCATVDGPIRFGEMQRPALSYRHGGRPRFSEFVR